MSIARKLVSLAATLTIGACGTALAAPIDVSYTVSGSAGDWVLDFEFANNLTGSGQYLYFLGVGLDPATASVAGNPVPFGNYDEWNGAWADGADVDYQQVWLSPGDFTHTIQVGHSQDGFLVHSTAATAPAEANWFAITYAYGAVYTGPGMSGGYPQNPQFQGTASLSAVPEPTDVALLLAGGALLGCAARRRGVQR